jgi:hypothetical protein
MESGRIMAQSRTLACTGPKPSNVRRITAVPELLYPGSIAAEWHFSQENATFHNPKKGT